MPASHTDCLRATSSTAPCECAECIRFVRYWAALTNTSEVSK